MLFTQQHQELARTTERIVAEHINPYVDEWEKAEIYPAHDVMKIFAEAGLLGIGKPAEFGGLDLDFSYEMVFAEALGNIRANGVSTSIGVQTTMCTPALAQHGNDELKRNYLAPTIAGELVGCIGVSELSAGSDVAQIKTTARRDGDDYIINGSKMWITNGVQGDWICLLANTSTDSSSGGRHRNKSLIVVPLKAKGVSVSRKLDKLGLVCSDTAELFFEDCRVPAENMLGEENKGFYAVMANFQNERMSIGAMATSEAQTALELTIEHLRNREAFGASLMDKQGIRQRLAMSHAKLVAAQQLLYHAAWLDSQGHDCVQEVSMVKAHCAEVTQEVMYNCQQFHGGMGYVRDLPIERMVRDARLHAIGGGATEVMLEEVAKRW